MDASSIPPLRDSIHLRDPSHSLNPHAGQEGRAAERRRSNLTWTRNTSFVTLMHPPEAASGALQISSGSDVQRRARAEVLPLLLLLLLLLMMMMLAAAAATMMRSFTTSIRQETHTQTRARTCRGPARLRARTHAGGRDVARDEPPCRSVRCAGLPDG